MDKKYIIAVAASVIAAILVGLRFGAILYKPPSPHILDIGYEINQVGTRYTIVFSGNVVNPRMSNVYDVTVYLNWSEIGGGRHTDSVKIGDMTGRSKAPFEKSYEFEYMITLKSYTHRVEFSDTP